jgi:NAD(P)-dependent dehydrogenase (short-subunit alcohol dehydrogenase family)
VHEAALDDWERMLAVNLRTALLASRAVVPHMLRQGAGRIVHVAARPALSAPAGFAPYAASKSAVMRLCESLSAELAGSGINVNCVVPGTLDTPENRQAMPGADRRGWVEPEAVADVVLFLLSQAARSVSGAAIPVYGSG